MDQVEPVPLPKRIATWWLPKVAIAGVLIPCAVVLIYLNGVGGDFVFDDVKLVRDNPWIGSWSETLEAFNIFSDRWENDEVRANYRPVRFLSYAIDWHVTKFFWPNEQELRPHVFHLHNILLHALNSVLVLLLLRRLLPQSGMLPAFLAIAWALHPVQTESVTYISGRRDVLFACFYLSAALVHIGGTGQLWRSVVVGILYVLALLTKEMAVTLPAFLLVVDLYLDRPADRRALAGHILLWLLVAGYVAFKLGMKNPGGGAPPWGGSLQTAVLTETRALFRYLWLFLYPVRLSLDWSYAAIIPSSDLAHPLVTFPAFFCAGALAVLAAYLFVARRSTFGVGLCLFLLALSPVMQLIPHPERFAERYLYLPILGLLIACVPFFRTMRSTKTGVVLATILVLIYAGRSYRRNQDWRNSETIWTSAATVNPTCARAHFALGLIFSDAKRWTEATLHLDQVFEILGKKSPIAPLERGQLLQARAFRAQAAAHRGDEKKERMQGLFATDPLRGELQHEARRLYRQAVDDYEKLLQETDVDGTPIKDNPRYAPTYKNSADVYFRLEEYDKAEPYYRRLRSLVPGTPYAVEARFWLGMIQLARGKVSLGRREMERAAEEAEDPERAYRFKAHLAHILLQIGRWEEALRIYDDDLLPGAEGETRRDINYARAKILDRLGDRAEAVAELRDILMDHPDFLPAHLSLMDVEIKEGRWRQAKKELAVLKANHGRLPELEAYEKQIAIQEALAANIPDAVSQPLDADKLMRAGRFHEAGGNWGMAIEAFKDAYLAAEMVKDSETALIAIRRLARCQRRAGQYTEAHSVLRRALRRAPDDSRLLKDLGALIAEDLRDFQEALVVYRRLYDQVKDAQDSFAIEAALALGDLYWREGAIEDAVAWYDTAAAIGTVPNTVHQRRGEIWEELENGSKARAAYRQYLKTVLDPERRREIEDRLRALPHEDG